MYDVDRHAHGIGDHDGAVRGLAFYGGRAGIGVGLGATVAFGKEFLLQSCNQVAVFGMYKRDRAKFAAAREAGVHLVIVHHQGALVGHEVLEGIHAPINAGGHLRPDFLRPAGNRHVEAVVDAGLACGAFFPQRQRAKQIIRAGDDVVNNHGRAARCRSKRPAFPCLGSRGAHEGHFQMGVRVNAAGDDISTFCVDDRIARKARADGGNDAAVNQHIGGIGQIMGNDSAAFDDSGHRLTPEGWHRHVR